jgi:gliding motility-associated-like protein
MFRLLLFLSFSFVCSRAGAQFQGLIVNEFSQGNTGNREYIEIVVVGNRTCTDSTADIRGWIFDDQNGWYGNNNSTQGHYRFRDVTNWSRVPFGSIILLYNSADKNLSITLPDDPTDANGDLAYIVPINSSAYLEQFAAGPNNASGPGYVYPAATSTTGYVPTTNQWQFLIALNNNNGDVISLVSPADRSSAFFSVGYGYTVNAGFQLPLVDIANVGGGNSASLSTGNYLTASDWQVATVPTNETPGLPNGGQNSAWISNMRLGRPKIFVAPSSLSVCYSTLAQQTNLMYTATRNSPTHYSLTWDALPANSFVPVTNAVLPAGTIPLAVPASTPSGTYTGYLTVNNAIGASCDTVVFTITVLPAPPTPAVAITQPTCTAPGALAITAPAGSGTTYSLDGVSYQASTQFANLPPGNYVVWVKDINGCIATTGATINPVPTAPVVPSISVQQPTCSMATGTITVTSPTGAGYSYSIDGTNFQTAPIFNGLPAGTYTVTVSNSSNCLNVTMASIGAAPVTPAAPTVTATHPGCGGITGSLQVTVVAGNSYSIDGIDYSNTSGVFSGLAPGAYAVTVRNSDGCVSAATSATILPPPAVPAVQLPAVTICPGAAAAVTAVTSPSGAYTYSWTVPAGLPDPGNVASFSSTVPGSYSVVVTTGSGCTVFANGTVSVNPLAAVSADNKQLCGSGTVALTGQPAGGVWSGTGVNGSQFDAAGLGPGNYVVTYTYTSNSCTGSANAVITVTDIPTTPTLYVSNQCNGTSLLTAANYTGTLLWNTGESLPAITVTAPGNYTLTQSAGGCTSAAAVGFANPLSPPAAPLIVSLDQPDCQVRTGTVTVTSPGTGVSYSIDALALTSATGRFANLPPGTYAISARSSEGCVSAFTFVNILPAPPVPATPTVQVGQPTCTNDRGAIGVLTPVGAGHQYSLNGGPFTASPLFSNLVPGSYTVQVQNSSGCTSASAPVQIRPATGTVTSNLTACIAEGASYNFNGQQLTATGNYTTTYVRSGLCDSVVRLYLVVPKTAVQRVSGCGTVTHSGVLYLSSTTLRDTVASLVTSCDSLYRVTQVVVNPAPEVTITACRPAGQTYSFAGQTLSASGTYMATFPSALGCDSTVHLLLTITRYQRQDLSACGQLMFNGVSYTRDTTLVTAIPSLLTGCDSIVVETNMTIIPRPTLVMPDGLTICRHQPVQLKATALNGTVEWIGFGSGDEISVSPTVTTTYTAMASSAPGCAVTGTVTVRVDGFDLQLTATPNPVIAGLPVTLQTTAATPYQILQWSRPFENSTATRQQVVIDTTLLVRVVGRSAGGCLDTALVQVIVDPLGDVFIPSAFTPNGDGRNDQFTVAGGSFKTFDLKVFNRWGELIFYSQQRTRGWDGRYAGREQPTGSYVYVLNATLSNGRRVEKRGTVTLIR